MRVLGRPATRPAVLLCVGVAMLMPDLGAAAPREALLEPPQAVVLVQARTVLDRRLAAFIEIQPGRYLAARTLQAACATPSLRADSLLLFFPDAQRCEHIPALQQHGLRLRLERLTGRSPVADPLAHLREKPYLSIAPPPPPTVRDKTGCTCPNTAPIGTVICDAQTRAAGTPITTVEYLASDADVDPLAGTFTYQRGADPVQAGLPSPLNGLCSPAAGTLQCTVTGNAPAQLGIFQLKLAVSDGTDTLMLTSQLEVVASNPGQIFVDGFENAVAAGSTAACP